MLPCKQDRGTLRGHGGREPQLGGLCGEGSRGKGFSTWHLIRKEFEEHVAVSLAQGRDRTVFS